MLYTPIGGSMQECSVCGLLFLGGGACPTCGSQVATDIDTEDIVMDDETIPGLEEIAEAIGDDGQPQTSSGVLPFGLGAKAGVIESSLPFGVGSFSEQHYSEGDGVFPSDQDPVESDKQDDVVESTTIFDSEIRDVSKTTESEDNQPVLLDGTFLDSNADPEQEEVSTQSEEQSIADVVPDTTTTENIIDVTNQTGEQLATPLIHQPTADVPEMWKIDAAEVDMDAIYSQEEEVIEVSFDDDMSSGDVEVTFDDFHHSPVEDSMASDDDAPELHPAKALPVDASGQPEISEMIDSAFEHMSNSAWMQAAQILSTASNNRQNDPSILNNLGLALLQSALEMDSKNDPMSSSQYEAAIMALRQGAKIDSDNNTILLNLSHALLVSGRAEKALGVLNVLRGCETNNVEIENTLGACLIQLGRDEEAESILTPYATDNIVSANLSLI